MPGTNIAFTLCSVNYLAQAKTLYDSLKTTNPGWEFIIGLVDKPGNDNFLSGLGCTIVGVEKLDIRGFDKMVQQYTVVELITSVKPFYFEWLLNHFPGTMNVVYFDPDIMIFQALTRLEQSLNNWDIILTPHFTAPVNDNCLPSELHVMQTGVYNLGFIAVTRSGNTFSMLRWWQNRLKDKCIIDLSRGLFVDQIWANLVPAYFERVLIDKYPGYNMAHWNLHERELLKAGNTYYVNGEPLVFYHFSHYSPVNPGSIAAHHSRFSFETRPDLKNIFETYKTLLIQNKYFELRLVPCFYAKGEKKKKRKRALETFLRMALPFKLKGKLKRLLRQ